MVLAFPSAYTSDGNVYTNTLTTTKACSAMPQDPSAINSFALNMCTHWLECRSLESLPFNLSKGWPQTEKAKHCATTAGNRPHVHCSLHPQQHYDKPLLQVTTKHHKVDL